MKRATKELFKKKHWEKAKDEIVKSLGPAVFPDGSGTSWASTTAIDEATIRKTAEKLMTPADFGRSIPVMGLDPAMAGADRSDARFLSPEMMVPQLTDEEMGIARKLIELPGVSVSELSKICKPHVAQWMALEISRMVQDGLYRKMVKEYAPAERAEIAISEAEIRFK